MNIYGILKHSLIFAVKLNFKNKNFVSCPSNIIYPCYHVVLVQSDAERIEELSTRETMLKNEIQELNKQITELHQQHADELERLGRENEADVQKLRDELARLKESVEADKLECGSQSELVYYQRHLEAVEQIDELSETVARQNTKIEDLQGIVQCRDAEIEQLKANISSVDTTDSGLLAAVQLDLERATSER